MSVAGQKRPRWRQSVVLFCIFIYCSIFLVRPPKWLPTTLQEFIWGARGALLRLFKDGVNAIGEVSSPGDISIAIYFIVVAGLVPVVLARLAGRSLADLGWRCPNRLALRYCIVAFLIAGPFLMWMVRSPTIARPYLKQLDQLGFLAFAVFYLINMVTEHVLLHGIVLGLARPDGRWLEPRPIPPHSTGFVGALRWLGMAMPPTVCSNELDKREQLTHQFRKQRLLEFSAWLGLAPGCLAPMLFSAMLFGLVHLGKDTRELVLAFPGGLAQAYIAYRSNSWFTPFFIHLATASAALLMMMRMQ